MDKKSLIGLGLIAAILITWLALNGPSKEQIARNKEIKDSLELAEKKAMAEAQAQAATQKINTDTLRAALSDSALKVQEQSYYKDFSPAREGKAEYVTIENENIKAYISTKGGHVAKVELKKYHRYGSEQPLVLFDQDSTFQSIVFYAYPDNKKLSTDSFYFKASAPSVTVNGNGKQSISMKMETANPGSYIEYTYTLKGGDYMLDYDVNFVNMQTILSNNNNQVTLNWNMDMPSQEKHLSKQREAATVYYKYSIEEPDNISPVKEDSLDINQSEIKWVCFKQQFFNSTIIAKKEFMKDGGFIKTSNRSSSQQYVKNIRTELGIPYNHTPGNEKFSMSYYFGPNHYNTLKTYNLELEKIIPTGWSIFSYINKWLVIPIMNWFGDMNMGIVILILTLIVKILLFPIAYKTYMSSAKMRVLKPEVDELNAKFGNNADPMKKQQETMSLYRKAGVNPLSGCIPMLLQFPILIALFAFIPAAIELRQKGFLWADDLSTYDSIWDFGYVPFINFAYGDHVSLFALLMFVSTLIYTWMNSAILTPQQNTQVPGMKFMMYFMPVIFLAVMNKYAAGLSWYYFLANIITFSQTWLMKILIDDKKIRAGLEANMKKPVKKSSFQARLEEMSKQQQQRQGAGKKK